VVEFSEGVALVKIELVELVFIGKKFQGHLAEDFVSGLEDGAAGSPDLLQICQDVQ
jgi:hypothetical protein